MARLVLDGPVGLPVGHLADMLRKALPHVRWQVGDGAQEGVVSLDRPASLFGRSGDAIILLGIEFVPRPLDPAIPAPAHRAHILLSGPSTDDREMAGRLLLIVADALTSQVDGALQPGADGAWYGRSVLAEGIDRLRSEPAPGLFQVFDFFAASPPVSALPAPGPPPSDPPPPTAQPFPRGGRDGRPSFGRKGV